MKNEQWEAIHNIFEEMEQLCGNLKGPLNERPLPLSVGKEEADVSQKADLE